MWRLSLILNRLLFGVEMMLRKLFVFKFIVDSFVENKRCIILKKQPLNLVWRNATAYSVTYICC